MREKPNWNQVNQFVLKISYLSLKDDIRPFSLKISCIENFILVLIATNYFADLDDTLYPLNFGLANAVPHNIQGKGERAWLCEEDFPEKWRLQREGIAYCILKPMTCYYYNEPRTLPCYLNLTFQMNSRKLIGMKSVYRVYRNRN